MKAAKITPQPCVNCGERPTWVKVGRKTELHHKGGTCPNTWEIWRKSRVASVRFWNLDARIRRPTPIL